MILLTKLNALCVVFSLCFVFDWTLAGSSEPLETCKDEKEFKNLLKTRPNLLIMFSKSDSGIKDTYKLLKEVNTAVKGIATVAYINCEINKKVCKKLKINPNPIELKHFNEGTFNKDYDRQLNKKSFVNFLKDPKGDIPWEEEESAKDIVHISDENSLNKFLKKTKLGILMMFYAPWCGYCKKLKPEYSSAATQLKNKAVLAAMNLDSAEHQNVKMFYNISGFPTLLYFKDGKLAFPFGGEHKESSIIEWMTNPEPPKEKEPEKSWADEEDVHVTFLTDNTFDEFLENHTSVLVKFYAPWCGHCKTMKPIYNKIAKTLKEENAEGKIAFVDTTKEAQLGQRFKIKSFPTVKYFKDGKFAWEYSEREEEKILEFMRNPQRPVPKVEEEKNEWKDEMSSVIHAEASNFASILKTKKHALAFFYAPWCGHCKNAKPHLAQAADHFKEDIKVAFVAVDCTKHNPVCEQYGVKGFPTIIYFNFGKNPKPYEGGREFKDFVKFMSNPNDPNAGKFDPKDDWIDIQGYEKLNLLDDSTFDSFIKSKPKVLVMFYAPWCGHCKTMKPDYASAAVEMAASLPDAYLAAIDTTKTVNVAKQFDIKGFPTLKYFENGEFKQDYQGGRSKADIIKFMTNPNPTYDPKEDWLDIAGYQHVNLLQDSTFDEFIKSKSKVLVMFYAPWCGHCKSMKPAFGEAATDMTRFIPGSYLAALDATKSPLVSQRFEIKGFPTLKYFQNGEFKFDYKGGRTKEDLINFMRDPKEQPINKVEL